MDRVSQVEGKRILSIVDDLLSDLESLSKMPVYGSPDLDGESSGIQSIIQDHLSLESKLEALVTSKDPKWAVPELYRDVKHSICMLSQDIKKAAYRTRDDALDRRVTKFREVVQAVRTTLEARLKSTVQEDRSNEEFLRDTIAREKKANADQKLLNKEVQSNKNLRERENNLVDVSIKKMTDQKQDFETAFLDEQKSRGQMSQMNETSAKMSYEAQLKDVEERLAAMTAGIAKSREDHKSNEKALMQANQLVETKMRDVISEYDDVIAGLTTEFEDLTAECEKDRHDVETLLKDTQDFKDARSDRDKVNQGIIDKKSEEIRQRAVMEEWVRIWVLVTNKGIETRRLAALKDTKKKGTKKSGSKSPTKSRATSPSKPGSAK